MTESSSASPDTNFDTIQHSGWSQISNVVEEFASLWSAAPPIPEISMFVPAEDEARRNGLIELIKIDMHHRWKQPETAWHLQKYLDEWPELSAADQMPIDLVYEEIHLRTKAGEDVKIDQYLEEFRAIAEPLKRMLETTPSLVTTSAVMKRGEQSFRAGQTVDDFDLLTELGSGAFATVFLARQQSMQRLVALKISADEGLEPQTLAQLDHPNIVRVYDQRAIPELGVRLMYMQYIAGGTLLDVLRRMEENSSTRWNGELFVRAIDQIVIDRGAEPATNSPLRRQLMEYSWAEVICEIGRQLAAGLDCAHNLGVLHRDIKPANVILSPEGQAKLVDFNISFCNKVDGASAATFFGGSLAYMSPEQLRACSPLYPDEPGDLDGRTDIHSLGILLFELLTLSRPFDRKIDDANRMETMSRLIKARNAVPTQIGQIAGGSVCPPGLEGTVLKCIATNVEDRFANAKVVHQRLSWILDPEVQTLVTKSTLEIRGIQKLMTLFMVLVVVAVNAFAGWFIFNYNWMKSITEDHDQGTFMIVQLVINAIAFPSAIAIFFLLAWPVARVMWHWMKADERIGSRIGAALDRNLVLGHYLAILCIVEWFAAGLLYPAILSLVCDSFTARGWYEFFASHSLAGLIAGAYTFFAITYFCVHIWHPRMIQVAVDNGWSTGSLRRLDKMGPIISFYQLVAASIPMIAVALIGFLGNSNNNWTLVVVSMASLFGFVFVFFLARKINAHIGALKRMIDPDARSN